MKNIMISITIIFTALVMISIVVYTYIDCGAGEQCDIEEGELINKYGFLIETNGDVEIIDNEDYKMTNDTNHIRTLKNIRKIGKNVEKYGNFLENFIRQDGSNLRIYLVKEIEGDTVALTLKRGGDNYILFIENTSDYDRAFDHEMFHLVEYYIKNHDENAFDKWNTYNFDSFEYGTEDSSYVLGMRTPSTLTYFTTQYSKSNEQEDRAELFSYLVSDKKFRNKIPNNSPLYKKAQYLENEINRFIDIKW